MVLMRSEEYKVAMMTMIASGRRAIRTLVRILRSARRPIGFSRTHGRHPLKQNLQISVECPARAMGSSTRTIWVWDQGHAAGARFQHPRRFLYALFARGKES